MIALESITLKVEVIANRDIDRQSENLQKLKGYQDLTFQAGWWGEPDYFLVSFSPHGFQLENTKTACEQAINRARKVKTNEGCQCYLDDFRLSMKRINERAEAQGMGYYVSQVK